MGFLSRLFGLEKNDIAYAVYFLAGTIDRDGNVIVPNYRNRASSLMKKEKGKCAIGLDLCSDESPCPLHHKWKPIRTDIREMLAAENLEELAQK